MVVSGGIGNTRADKRMRGRRRFADRVLSDLWTFDLGTKTWAEVHVPGLNPMYGHMVATWDDDDQKLMFFGGTASSSRSDSTKAASKAEAAVAWSAENVAL